MKLFTMPYMRGSKSARLLCRLLPAKAIKLVGSRFKPKLTRMVLNWGNSNPSVNIGNQVINKPEAIALASNKLLAFQQMEGKCRIPKWTVDNNIVKNWFDESPDTVVFCRKLLRSSEGKGIVIARNFAEVVAAPLYTKRIKKAEEYRIHVFRGEVIDVAQKRLRAGFANRDERNRYVRNFANGWVHAHDNVNCPQSAKDEALKAVAALGLDFGAVDVGVTAKGLPFVFEVNTAPGISNKVTVAAYVNAINNYKKEEEQKYEQAFRNRVFRRY